jgi:hypothetical protein
MGKMNIVSKLDLFIFYELCVREGKYEIKKKEQDRKSI